VREGDCDNDDQCGPGLSCKETKGSFWRLSQDVPGWDRRELTTESSGTVRTTVFNGSLPKSANQIRLPPNPTVLRDCTLEFLTTTLFFRCSVTVKEYVLRTPTARTALFASGTNPLDLFLVALEQTHG
jgi:hypothetical protein